MSIKLSETLLVSVIEEVTAIFNRTIATGARPVRLDIVRVVVKKHLHLADRDAPDAVRGLWVRAVMRRTVKLEHTLAANLAAARSAKAEATRLRRALHGQIRRPEAPPDGHPAASEQAS